jgi:hypothetical protein
MLGVGLFCYSSSRIIYKIFYNSILLIIYKNTGYNILYSLYKMFIYRKTSKYVGDGCEFKPLIKPVVSSSTHQLDLVSDRSKPTIQQPWNQTSDQSVASVQRRGGSVRNIPGGQTPGGVGCDIKHNSYERYLNKLKRRGHTKELKNTSSFDCCGS